MNSDFDRFRRRITGKTISCFRLAGNSLIIYIETQPGEDHGFILWFEPTWHLAGVQKVLAGSRQVQDETEELKINDALSQLRTLIGKKVIDLIIEQRSNDLVALIEGDCYIKTFVSDPTDDWTWHIIDKDAGLRLHADPLKISLLEESDNNQQD